MRNLIYERKHELFRLEGIDACPACSNEPQEIASEPKSRGRNFGSFDQVDNL